ncbi:NAD(P)H-hydrate dehydratase [Acuticoccus sp. MNP-M23]|uniref:NAD(P)H-hydrate dehydratase n=1 Tax=Acuticoccus sp. MNP-M23 TaxID=3072793 RepID=UPI0028150CFE|nr:NAD(P)H-hydrate dehydratase [Acuticoccus sp. MNP-M23]WMS42074.1 NAD(P)H-hydrate dehydratase [Acuticoccus sp. MNP-M23]
MLTDEKDGNGLWGAALVSPGDIAKLDRLCAESGIPVATLMDRAGHAVANAVAARHPAGTRVDVLVGPGNNGGDGAVAAEVLRRRGFDVVLLDASEGKGATVARDALAAYRGPRLAAEPASLRRGAVVVDGLFGVGLSRPLDGEMAALVEAANTLAATIYAVDIASGINGGNGAVDGPAIRADWTVALHAMKPGHALSPGARHAGRVVVEDIGIPPRIARAITPAAFLNKPGRDRLAACPLLAEAGHKYDRGSVYVLSGPIDATGAARLAATAALRCGAGLVTVLTPPSALMVNAMHLTAVMVKAVEGADALRARIDGASRPPVVLLGPGLPPDARTRDMVLAALSSTARVVLDAGALTAFADEPETLKAALRAKGKTGQPAILTPHGGEFSRLFASGSYKLSRGRAAAAESRAVVVEKGADTVINGEIVDIGGPPWLATAGTGDVLAGLIAGLHAQGFTAEDAACLGVEMQGEMARRLGPGLISEDLLTAIAPVRSALEERLTAARPRPYIWR